MKYLTGIFIVLLYRLIEFLCSSSSSSSQTQHGNKSGQQQQQQQHSQHQPTGHHPAGHHPLSHPHGHGGHLGPHHAHHGHLPPGVHHGTHSDSKTVNVSGTESSATGGGAANFFNNDLGWMAEAKDWAGELISGQSTTGRILVSCHTVPRSEGGRENKMLNELGVTHSSL